MVIVFLILPPNRQRDIIIRVHVTKERVLPRLSRIAELGTWHRPVIPVPGRLRQEESCEFEDSLGVMVSI